MKLIEFIEKLNLLKDENGDLEVFVHNLEFDSDEEATEIVVRKRRNFDRKYDPDYIPETIITIEN